MLGSSQHIFRFACRFCLSNNILNHKVLTTQSENRTQSNTNIHISLLFLGGWQETESSGPEADEAEEVPVVLEAGESTDAESENSNDGLNVHHFLADLEAEFDQLQAQEAEMDHTDGFVWDLPASLTEDADLADSEPEDLLDMPAAAVAEISDEDMEDAELREQEVPPPKLTRRRLRGKQAPPAAYQEQPPAKRPKEVLKRPGMLKKPASKRGKRPNELCRGYRRQACRFDPQNPGEPAGVHTARDVERCIFCASGHMQEAHATTRRALQFDFLFLFSLCVRVADVSRIHDIDMTGSRFRSHANIFPPSYFTGGRTASRQLSASSTPRAVKFLMLLSPVFACSWAILKRKCTTRRLSRILLGSVAWSTVGSWTDL